MFVQMKKDHSQEELMRLTTYLEHKGFQIKDASSEHVVLFGILGDTKSLDLDSLSVFPGVEKVTRISIPYKLASKAIHPKPTVIKLNHGMAIGDGNFIVMSGPCSVESEAQLRVIAQAVYDSGSRVLRGGVFKPRTSPYAFQGLGIEGLKLMRKVADELGMLVISELMGTEHMEEFIKYVDIIQIGARNMQNFDFLKALGRLRKPILLKRGLSATIEEWLMSAEYILAGGNEEVILCERGIRTFEKYTRNTLDISAVLAVKQLSHLPIIVDPSHAAGRFDMIEDLSLAALAVGADGIIVEVHHKPEEALSDGAQSLKPEKFDHMMKRLNMVSKALDKRIV